MHVWVLGTYKWAPQYGDPVYCFDSYTMEKTCFSDFCDTILNMAWCWMDRGSFKLCLFSCMVFFVWFPQVNSLDYEIMDLSCQIKGVMIL